MELRRCSARCTLTLVGQYLISQCGVRTDLTEDPFSVLQQYEPWASYEYVTLCHDVVFKSRFGYFQMCITLKTAAYVHYADI